jgi:DNA-binding beta-propeller fold protein YncE
MTRPPMRSTAILLAALTWLPVAANAQLAVSANDAKAGLVDGVTVTNPHPAPDTATIIDLGVFPPRVLATVEAPASVIGPPMSVAIAPNASFALVTGAMKLDPADPTKTVPDDVVTIIDLKSPRILATLRAGQGASGVAFSPSGSLVLVANRAEGTVSVFYKGGPAGKIALGDTTSGPSAVAFTPDGKMALATRDGDHKISVLAIDVTTVTDPAHDIPARIFPHGLVARLLGDTAVVTVTDTGHDISAGIRPYGLVVRPQGDYAIVANIGAGAGDAATVSFIDLKAAPPRVVNTISVGPTPEGLALSPDGKTLAVTVMNGSNQPRSSPFFHDFGLLKLYRVAGANLIPLAQAHIGHWCQGAAWNRAGTVLLAQCMADHEIEIFRLKGKTLTRAGAIPITGGPAGIAVAR